MKPPKRYVDLSEIEAFFTQQVDSTAGYIASLIGRHKPRLSRSDKQQYRRRMRGLIDAATPYLLGLGALSGRLNADEARYALLEGLLKVQMRATGIKIGVHEDAFEVQIRLAAQNAKPPSSPWASHPSYQGARTSLSSFVRQLCDRLSPMDLQQLFERWAESDDAKRHIHAIRQLMTAMRRFRANPPQKLTDRLIAELTEEYRTSSALFEQRLRMLVSWAAASTGNLQSWSHWKKQSLKNLLELASTHPELAPLQAAIDRNVRNALAHGGPEVDVNTGEVRFSDRGVGVVWTFREFYERTRDLTLVALAMLSFESLVQLAQCQAMTFALWSSLAPPATHSASDRV